MPQHPGIFHGMMKIADGIGMKWLPGEVLSHYRLIAKLGEGGMGIVWKAVDMRLDREAAIKLLPGEFLKDPRRLARFESEAKTIAALNHPNIVTIYEVVEAGGERVFAMELVRGRTLAELIRPDGLPHERLLELAVPIADAIGAAHERGIVHGDLKPSNIMVSDEGRVKVLDFGLARSEGSKSGDAGWPEAKTTSMVQEGTLAGTLLYMSPEQIQGRQIDHRSDIFSLGILLYEMSSGLHPFIGETAPDLMAAILKDTPRSLTRIKPELPASLMRLISQCLEKDPRHRLQSALDLRNALEEIRQGGEPAAREVVPSIAVLPFADMSQEQDQEHFCEGVAEEIINALTKITDLRVASRTSSFQFKTGPRDSREIGVRLGVSTLLEGSVRKAGTRLRITAQLIDVASGYHLWSERYDRDLQDVFAIQDDIAQAIVRALEVRLSPHERNILMRTPTTDVRAYDFYLRGRKYFYQYGRKGIEFALQMFKHAIEIDPAYALAYAGMADCHSYLYANAEHSEENRRQAEATSFKALELDPNLAEAHASRGVALSLCGKVDEADAAFETAIRLSPKLFEARYFYARHSFAHGRLEKAARLYEQACAVRPEDYQAPLLVGQVYADLGRASEAESARRRGVKIAEDRLMLSPDDVRALYMGANGLVALGERGRGLEWCRRALSLEPEEAMVLYNVGCIYSMAGEIEPAIDCLDKSIHHGFSYREWLEKDSNLDALRSHPRFRALIEGWR